MILLQTTQQLDVVKGVTLQSVCTLEYERGRDRSHPMTAHERLWWCLQRRHSTRSSASTRLEYLV